MPNRNNASSDIRRAWPSARRRIVVHQGPGFRRKTLMQPDRRCAIPMPSRPCAIPMSRQGACIAGANCRRLPHRLHPTATTATEIDGADSKKLAEHRVLRGRAAISTLRPFRVWSAGNSKKFVQLVRSEGN
jgi:hypothetical protein